MSEVEIPTWAKRRAGALAAAEPVCETRRNPDPYMAYSDAFARYIAEHEKPPTDPLALAFGAAVGNAFAKEGGWIVAYERFRNELRERGLSCTDTFGIDPA